jgi:signal transduction histidine kinase
MMKLNPSLWPIRWQIAALLILTQVVAHIATITTANLAISRTGDGKNDVALALMDPMLTVLKIAEVAGPERSDALLRGMVALDPRFTTRADLPAEPEATIDDEVAAAVHRAAPQRWQDEVRVIATGKAPVLSLRPAAPFGIGLAAPLPSGGWLIFEPDQGSFIQNVPRIVAFFGFLILTLPLTLLLVWAGSALVAPIARLAQGAERFAETIDAPALPERGAVEVQQATRAFNRMRDRIRKLISDRSQTLASIGHDMRTPLTRLRLRLELVEQNDVTAHMDEDIRALERMIDDALEFLRSEHKPLALTPVDLAVLARTVTDEYADLGHSITFSGPHRVVATCDPELLRRTLDNVVGNAAKYATNTQVSLTECKAGQIRIEVRDDGPGIPLDHRERVLEPFARIESVRAGTAQNGKGFGLGLAIARDLVERHSGKLELTDNQPRGLTVTILLPCDAPATEGRPT